MKSGLLTGPQVTDSNTSWPNRAREKAKSGLQLEAGWLEIRILEIRVFVSTFSYRELEYYS